MNISSQKEKWQKEYTSDKGVPTTFRTSPSSSVTNAIDFLESNDLITGNKVLDLGSGTGRNAIYLASKGYQVVCVDYIQEALDVLKKRVVESHVEERIELINRPLNREFPFNNEEFDIALDIATTMSLNDKEIELFESETKRILKNQGVFISYVLADDDEYMLKYGDKSKGYYESPLSGIREHCRSKEVLQEIYEDWKFLKMEKIEKNDIYYGEKYLRRLWWMILQKI